MRTNEQIFKKIKEDSRCFPIGDWLPEEVIAEFEKYQKNQPEGDIADHIESAFHATAHQ